MLISIVLMNGGMLISAWIRIQKDLTKMSTKIVDIEVRLRENKVDQNASIKELNRKMEIFHCDNSQSHEKIVQKLEEFAKTIAVDTTEIKIQIAKICAK